MSNPTAPDSTVTDATTPGPQPATQENQQSFQDILSQFEKSHVHKPAEAGKGVQGTVITVSGDSVYLDIGYKTEGILPTAELRAGEALRPGDTLVVSIKGRDPEGYYQLSRAKIQRVTDWESLERAFNEKATIVGTVTGVVKGGLSVDVGVRAFMPASRSGTHDAAEMEKLVEQEIRCRIIKLDIADEDVVVDRRAILEEEERAGKERRFSEVKEGETVTGTVRSLMEYGAFVDIGGVEGLLHVAEIAWTRITRPSDVLTVGQEIEAVVLKVDPEKKRISLGMKQLQPHPWDAVPGKYSVGERVRGTVTRLTDFGAFVELEPGVEGLIHISEMSWARKVRKPSDVVKVGDTVEAVILGVNAGERRISLGLKQALGDPWAEVPRKFPVGSVVEGPVISVQKFGAFVQVAEGVEGMIHVGDMSAEKRINHPQEVVKLGQPVKAQVLEVDTERRRLRLGIKQMVPSSLDEYIAEHKAGDVVTGRMTEINDGYAQVELGEGVFATCRMKEEKPAEAAQAASGSAKADLSSLSSMLQARWKGAAASGAQKHEAASAGQVRSFRIARLDPEHKTIELELA
ncbi:MAG TPA: 30S ribosomal protein S1 [Candidatus Angelobacter sp.]|nr:30S ribosomal protein S1 [Candidatus Angelobacter sp.]